MNAVVVSPICPLHTEPSFAAPLADEALCGWPLEVLEEPCTGWARVRTHYRYEGYAPSKGLIFGAGCTRRWGERRKQVVFSSCADVLDRPAVQGCILTTLPRGALAAPLGEPDGEGWQKISLPDGREGYTKRSLLGTYYEKPASEDPERLRKQVVDAALSYLGTQYRWGGKSPQGIDCSGLAFMAYFLNGVLIYRDAKPVEGFPIREISQGALAPADLLFFPGHVALYLGEGRYLHATAKPGSDGVVINSLDPAAANYRPDLQVTAVGSLFPPVLPAAGSEPAPQTPPEAETRE